MKCKECNKPITGLYKDSFCGGYEEYCYECGEKQAYKDYEESERQRFYAEVEREDPDFNDFYENADQFI